MKIEGVGALVIGGGGGFGGATVRRLHAAGAKVAVCDLDETKGNAVVSELGDGSVYVKTDVTDDASIQNAIDRAAELAPLRIVVIAHGGREGGGRTLDKENNPTSIDGFRRAIDIFLNATYNVGRLAAAAMAKSEPMEEGERGVIIQTASIAGYEGTIGQASYGAAKAGIIGLTLPMARDLAPVGVRVVTIAPGTFLTPAFGDVDPEQLDAMWAKSVQFPKRMGRPVEYAQLAQQIAENIYLNGETIRLDGGLRFSPRGT